MIKDLPGTNASKINRALVSLRADGGAIALGRVLTLLVVTGEDDAETAIADANFASREHPCRVLVAVNGGRRGSARLDGQIRLGGDAGASEVVVLRSYGPLVDHVESVIVPLLLPDAPTVAWWPGTPPETPSTAPVGRLAKRRIIDSARAARPSRYLTQQADHYAPGDTDLAWSRITMWRGLLAAALDEGGWDGITSVTVTGASDSPSTDLMAAWLAQELHAPVTRARSRAGSGLVSVRIRRTEGVTDLVRPSEEDATLTVPGKPTRRVAMPKRPDRDCLAEELRRLDPDDVYGEVVRTGLSLLDRRVHSATEEEADAPSESDGHAVVTQPVEMRSTPRRALSAP